RARAGPARRVGNLTPVSARRGAPREGAPPASGAEPLAGQGDNGYRPGIPSLQEGSSMIETERQPAPRGRVAGRDLGAARPGSPYEERLRSLLDGVAAGSVAPDEAAAALRDLPFADL